jgi:hypothetical protein
MPALSEKFRIYIDRNLSPAARSARLASFARERLAEVISSGRGSKDYTRVVDGMAGRDESQVRGDGGGRIEYLFSHAGAATQRALEFLRARAPNGAESNRPGHAKFRDSFYVGVNGRFIRAVDFKPSLVPPGAEIVISNTAPDNRLVDVQMVGTQTIRYATPAGMYDDTVRMLRREFPTLKAKRVYTMRFTGQYILRRGQKAGTPVQSPALIISTR